MTTWCLRLLLALALSSIILGCSPLRSARPGEEITVCSDHLAHVLHFPQDSAYFIVYNKPLPYHPQTSDDLLSLIRQGMISPRYLLNNLNNEALEDIELNRPRLRFRTSINCLAPNEIAVGADSVATVIEVAVAKETEGASRDTYELGVLFNFGTDIALYSIRLLPRDRIQIEHTGWIF